MNKLEREIPCSLTVEGYKKLKEAISTPLFWTLDSKREDFSFKYNPEKWMVEVFIEWEYFTEITNAFWSKIVDIHDPEHWED